MARAADEEAIRKAVERGIAYLRKQQLPRSGFWPFNDPEGPGLPPSDYHVGATAFACVTLLENRVSPEDRQIQKAIHAVRSGSIELHADLFAVAGHLVPGPARRSS